MHLWNITDQRIVDSASVHEMVTAIAFAPRGERLVVGSMKGRCRFFACAPGSWKLEYEAQIGALTLKNPEAPQEGVSTVSC